MCEGREGKGARRGGADGTGLAEAAGLVSRSDGAEDDLVVFEPAWALAPPSSFRPNLTARDLPMSLGAPCQSLLRTSPGLQLGDT